MAKKRVPRKKLLKEPDEFITTTTRVLRWTSAHRRTVAAAAVIFFLILVASVAWKAEARKKEAIAATLYYKAYKHYRDAMDGKGGKEARTEGFREALKGFDQLIEEYGGTPHVSLALLYRGNALYELGKFERAVDSYKAFLSGTDEDEPLRVLAYNGMGYSYMALGRYKEAIDFFQRMETESRGILSEEALVNIGRCYEAMKDFPNALKAYKRVIAEHPDSFYKGLLKGKIARLSIASGRKGPSGDNKGAGKD